eukprot:TRINITY_DN49025_c0_g1_i1.p2 TRINITY_DN49025_c0_g1~~TRINITY_DN49025_c0_g1_i1.p2  ORF type:complete len:286 (+),score=62.75 TRINITY_DN49025_c0_g1_i1:117-860(+)
MDFIKEQEQIDKEEREDRRLHGDGISLAKPVPVEKLQVGPQLEKQVGFKEPKEIWVMMKKAQAPVVLNVYAVGHSKLVAEINAIAQDMFREGGIFHGAIEVYDKEWSFGGCSENEPGVFCCEPRRCSMHTYRQSFYLGDCKKSPAEVEQILRSMLPDWMGPTYDLLHKNCCSFSNAFAQKLGVGEIPEWVHHLADVGSTLSDDAKAALLQLHKLESGVVAGRNSMLESIFDKKAAASIEKRCDRCCF